MKSRDWLGLTVEPVEGGVRGAVSALGLAAVGNTTSSHDAVDVGDTDATTSVTEVKPVNSTGTIRASGGSRRGLDAVELLADEKLFGLIEVKGRNSSSVEEVMSKVRELLLETLNLEVLLLGEGVGGRSSDAVCVEVERDLSGAEDVGSERCPFIGSQR
jgi:hypothetical protein